jgi:PAS domain S-box-containing protein
LAAPVKSGRRRETLLDRAKAIPGPNDQLRFIGDAGTVGARLRTLDWATSPLGPPADWPDALRTMAGVCLNSPFPLLLWWGEAFAVIYNDDWVRLAGAPDQALARAAATAWPELWQAMAPQLRRVFTGGESIETDKLTGAYANLAFSHMPVRNADGSIGGVLSAVRESVAREGLRRERELLQSIIDTIPVMITLFEPGAKVQRVNRAFERIVGWTAREIEDISLMEECYPDPAYRAQIRQFMQAARPEWFDIRMRVRDGRFIETSWSNMRMSDNTQIGIGIDITDRKQAEQQRTLLINELNHRVKNTLATVQSLAVQSLRAGARVPDARERFEARLTALAQAHDLLTIEGWLGVNLSDVVERAVAPFRAANERIVIAGPPVRLQPKQALAISMALHELGTNALKYGALSNDAGRVQVAWGIAPEADDALELVWREQGGPPVLPPVRKGFGSRLLERNLARELDGKTTLDYRADGLVCRITCGRS